MQKRAQVTLFIIIGVVILFGAVLFFSLNSSQRLAPVTELPSEIAPVNSFVLDCIKSTATDAINYVALQGGYYDKADDSFLWSFIWIPYYYDNGAVWIPSKVSVEKELSKYLNENLVACTQGFSAFKKAGFTVHESAVDSSAQLSAGLLTLSVNYPIEITKGVTNSRLSDFSATVPTALFSFYNYSISIVGVMEKKPDFVPLSYMVELGKRYGFTTELTYINDTVVFGLVPRDSGTLPSVYAFAARFAWQENSKKVVLSQFPLMNATVGYPFVYKIPAKGTNLSYSAFTAMFKIDNKGFINWTPRFVDRGIHRILVKVKDASGNEDSGILVLNVVSDNNPPNIELIPDQFASVGKVFSYTVKATDPDKETIFFSLAKGPAKMQIDTLSGKITFTPDATGVFDVTVLVVDIRSAVATKSFKVTVQ